MKSETKNVKITMGGQHTPSVAKHLKKLKALKQAPAKGVKN